ncbi:DUF421 domain-containing protein [Chitinophaga sp. RCC_12]|uniref:DUF421 domain-containing protein n=1 Tax=Chitinophaga sp. RCC_12 TaxID=3239226 RepID=UPI003524161C
MEAYQINLSDWQRILQGEVPLVFYVELVFRVTFIYLLIIVCMRMMGKRMASQLTRNELAALSSLAAAIGLPILSPERGLLPATIVAFTVVGGQRLMAYISTRNESFNRWSQGETDILVENGCLQLKQMKKTRISRERLYAQLRTHGVLHLGVVKRMYFEANGTFILIRQQEPRPGLTILPEKDDAFENEQSYDESDYVCSNCGKSTGGTIRSSCDNCHQKHFIRPVKSG